MSTRVLEQQLEAMQRVHALRYDVVDAWVTASSYRAWTEWLLGDEVAALRDSSEAVHAARRLRHPFSHALALSFACWMHQFRGDLEQLRECAQEALTISHEHGFEFWIGWNEALLGWAVSIEGNPRVGAEQIAAGIRRWMATGSRLGRSYLLALQVQALLRARQVEEAGVVLDEALECVEQTQERFWEAELYRLRASWLQAQGRSADEVDACREQALAVARAQKAVSLVRRCELAAGRTPHDPP
jgi:tetratricopeptide (TPR) repeat protein